MALTPRALDDVAIGTGQTGETEYARNVYEYRDGHVFLISDGRDVAVEPTPGVDGCGGSSAVCLVGVSGSGRDVFFTTSDGLVPGDTDTQLDYYDARVCSASEPCISAGAPQLPPCAGEACHGVPAPAPGVPVPGSASFEGPGNQSATAPAKPKPKPKRCRRGLIRRHGRCVRVKHRRAHRAKRHDRRAARRRGGGGR